MQRLLAATIAGLGGALTLTAAHQLARIYIPGAPRLDIVGKRAINQALAQADQATVSDDELELPSLVGDVIANSVYYALAAVGGRASALNYGCLLGAAAGVAAVVLPEQIGLGQAPDGEKFRTQVMTVAWSAAWRQARRPTPCSRIDASCTVAAAQADVLKASAHAPYADGGLGVTGRDWRSDIRSPSSGQRGGGWFAQLRSGSRAGAC